MKEHIGYDECPFRAGDIVKCNHSGMEATVLYVEDEHVFCLSSRNVGFYRTWTHDLDRLFHKSGGGLTLVERPSEPVQDVLIEPPSSPSDSTEAAPEEIALVTAVDGQWLHP